MIKIYVTTSLPHTKKNLQVRLNSHWLAERCIKPLTIWSINQTCTSGVFPVINQDGRSEGGSDASARAIDMTYSS